MKQLKPATAILAALLLAVNPSFVFWSRQGIFVTNLTALLFVAVIAVGSWLSWQNGQRAAGLLEPLFTAIGAQCFALASEHKLVYHAAAVFGNIPRSLTWPYICGTVRSTPSRNESSPKLT